MATLVTRISQLTGYPRVLVEEILNAEAAAVIQLCLEQHYCSSPLTHYSLSDPPSRPEEELWIMAGTKTSRRTEATKPGALGPVHAGLLYEYQHRVGGSVKESVEAYKKVIEDD